MVNRPVGSWQGVWEPLTITVEAEENLHVMCDFLLSDPAPRRIRIQEDHVFVYAYDRRLFDRIHRLGVCRLRDVTGVELVGQAGTVNLRSSSHAWRTYLRARRFDTSTAASVRAFLQAQKDVRLSPSLSAWCDNTWLWTQRHFFFDHDSHSTMNMLELIAPGLVKCTLPITTDK